MFITTTNKGNVIPFKSLVARINICRHVNSSKMAYVDWSISVRQRRGNRISLLIAHEIYKSGQIYNICISFNVPLGAVKSVIY